MQQRHSVERLLARANAHVWAARPAALVAAVLELEVAIRYLLHLVIVQLFALKVQDFCDLKPLKFTVLLHFVWVRGRNRRVGRPEVPFAGRGGGLPLRSAWGRHDLRTDPQDAVGRRGSGTPPLHVRQRAQTDDHPSIRWRGVRP